MHTIELTDDELRLLQNALHAYLDDFGHEEADILREVKELMQHYGKTILIVCLLLLVLRHGPLTW